MSDTPVFTTPAPNNARLILTLGLAGLFSGLLIVGAYEITLGPITANREAALKKAVLEVLPGATSMQPLVWDGETLEPMAASTTGESVIYAGYDSVGSFAGYAIPGSGAGFQDNIALIFGFEPVRRRIVGLQILESRETPGLGDKIFKDQAWLDAFRDLAVDPAVEVVKDGAKEAYQIDAITGATISSKAVAKIVNASDDVWLPRLPAPGSEPELIEVPVTEGEN